MLQLTLKLSQHSLSDSDTLATTTKETEKEDRGEEGASASNDRKRFSLPESTSLFYHSENSAMATADFQYDQHSSEEELEVINSNPQEIFSRYTTQSSCSRVSRGPRGGRTPRPTSAAPPEKRKWSQTCSSTDPDRLASPFTAALSVKTENDENSVYNMAAHSSDDEILRSPDALPAPVRFRTSPPMEALKPLKGGSEGRTRGQPLAALSCSCPTSTGQSEGDGCGLQNAASHLFHYQVSPRKRSRHSTRRHIQRPCLDFDKMQQLKVRAVTAWRHGSTEHSGELSVFCW